MAAYDPKDGNLLWEAKLPSGTREDLLFEGGWIVVSCEDGMARAIRDGGREVIAVLPTPREEASYPSPKSRPLAVKGMVLFGSEGTGREFSLVELPVPGAASPHIGYRWGAREEGAEVSGAAAGSGELFLLFSNGILRRVSLAQGPRPGDRAARVLPPKEKAVGAPVVVDQTLLVASEKGLIALQRGQDENVEIWKWTAPEGMLITTGPVVAGRTVVLCSRDGRMHALRRD